MNIQVYPEYYKGELLDDGIEIYGRFTEKKSRMFLAKNGEVKIWYDKLNTDDTNEPGDPKQEINIFEDDEIAIGLVCCNDLQKPDLLSRVRHLLDKSKRPNKLVCISAHMDKYSGWDPCKSSDWHDYYVVLSNGKKPGGVPSFIAGTNGAKLDCLILNVGKYLVINRGCTESST